MASKKYAYYNKGNKIAIIQRTDAIDGGNLAVAHCTVGTHANKTDCEAAGGQWIPGSSSGIDSVGEYTSPVDNVTKGLEIEYSYAPTYNITSTGTEEIDAHRFIGWGSDGTNLLLFTYATTSEKNISSLFAADDWILIKGSGRWTGLHQVSSASSTGILTLKTKCNLNWSKSPGGTGTFASDETFTSTNNTLTQQIVLMKELTAYRDSLYLFIQGSEEQVNNGFFKMSGSDSLTDGVLTVVNKYAFSLTTGLVVEAAAAFTAAVADEDIIFYQTFKEDIVVYEGIEVIEDESFEFDLNRKQALALVYYVKARLSEDLEDFQKREYYMRLFKKNIENDGSNKTPGAFITQGHWYLK